jgi:hypothetical protein
VISTEPTNLYQPKMLVILSSNPHSIVLDATRCFHLANATVLMRACPEITKAESRIAFCVVRRASI